MEAPFPASTDYPAAHQSEVVDDFHGTAVADPYRWLEDSDDARTRAWVAAQNRLTRRALDGVPGRDEIWRRLTALWNYPRVFTPQEKGSWYYFYRNEGLQNQPVLYRQQGLEGTPQQVLDPNQLSGDGTAAITSQAISKDGSHLAYGVSYGGSDRQEIRILNVATGTHYEETLYHCRFAGIAWRHDETGMPLGFYYNRDPAPVPEQPDAPPLHNKLYWHALGSSQAIDQLIYERPDAPKLNFTPQISEDGRYLILHVWHAAIDRNRLYYRPVDSESDFVRLIDEPDAAYHFVGNVNDTFYLHTDAGAANGRVVAVDLKRPDREAWQEIVPAGPDAIDDLLLAGDKLIILTLHHAHHRLTIYGQEGGEGRSLPLPEMGTVTGLNGRQSSDEIFFRFQSFLHPPAVYRYNLVEGDRTLFFAPQTDFAAAAYRVEQHFVPSGEGTAVPIYLVGRCDSLQDGNAPVLLYGYGGFNVSQTPTFAPERLYWLEQGGIFALANLRGGGEYGETWHRAGMLEQKQNVFDDFIAVATWLISEGYTAPERLAIMGRSNGGLLVAAVMLQRPELFGAVVCVVPVTDMLRFHKFTAGRYWTAEYGNAEGDPTHFQFLYAYSPLHNVRAGVSYPPILITSAEGDDRVVPLHALKFTAALQTAVSGSEEANPILLRFDTRSGHGLGKPIRKWIGEFTDIFAFLQATLR